MTPRQRKRAAKFARKRASFRWQVEKANRKRHVFVWPHQEPSFVPVLVGDGDPGVGEIHYTWDPTYLSNVTA